MDRYTYLTDADRCRVTLLFGQLQGLILAVHETEETSVTSHLTELTKQLSTLLFPLAHQQAVAAD